MGGAYDNVMRVCNLFWCDLQWNSWASIQEISEHTEGLAFGIKIKRGTGQMLFAPVFLPMSLDPPHVVGKGLRETGLRLPFRFAL